MIDTIGSSLIGGGASLIGGVLQNNWNRRAAERSMGFTERMSNTAHQREVEDLRAAGLNPILSAGGSGASRPAGTSYQAENVVGAAISSALDIARMKKELSEADANIDLLTSQKKKADMETKVMSRNLPEAELKNDFYDVVRPIIKKMKESATSNTRGWNPPKNRTSIPRMR